LLQYWAAGKIEVERGDIRDVVDSTGTINAVTPVLVGSQVSEATVTMVGNSVAHISRLAGKEF